MRRVLRIAAASLAVLALSAVLALADPELRVSYVDGVPRIEIAGSYPQARYTVWRRPSIDAHAVPIGSENVLCLGSCFVDDPTAEPGHGYFYDFDLELADGSLVSFGPYAVTISPALAARIRARVVPNPGRGRAAVELYAGGAGEPIEVDARLFDLQGRVPSRAARARPDEHRLERPRRRRACAPERNLPAAPRVAARDRRHPDPAPALSAAIRGAARPPRT